jgi:hypothetical protein
VVLALLVALGILSVRRMRGTQTVTVAESLVLSGQVRSVEPDVAEALSELEGVRHVEVAEHLHAVHVSRSPAWTIVPACLLFPVGLVVPFLVRETLSLDVSLAEEGADASRAVLSGRTEQHVLDRVRAALGGLAIA